jgi:site-specific DNA-methyltransferase (adenine-specific)
LYKVSGEGEGQTHEKLKTNITEVIMTIPKEKYVNIFKGVLPRDVIKVPALAGGAGKKERVDHPTQKPLNLCDTLIKASLNKSSHTLLVVPFVGSGSECVSAKNGVNFIGFEINGDYINRANERLYDINNIK